MPPLESDFPSMHADDAAKLPHVSLEELSARVPRTSALIPVQRRDRTDYYREYYKRARRARLAQEKKP